MIINPLNIAFYDDSTQSSTTQKYVDWLNNNFFYDFYGPKEIYKIMEYLELKIVSGDINHFYFNEYTKNIDSWINSCNDYIKKLKENIIKIDKKSNSPLEAIKNRFSYNINVPIEVYDTIDIMGLIFGIDNFRELLCNHIEIQNKISKQQLIQDIIGLLRTKTDLPTDANSLLSIADIVKNIIEFIYTIDDSTNTSKGWNQESLVDYLNNSIHILKEVIKYLEYKKNKLKFIKSKGQEVFLSIVINEYKK